LETGFLISERLATIWASGRGSEIGRGRILGAYSVTFLFFPPGPSFLVLNCAVAEKTASRFSLEKKFPVLPPERKFAPNKLKKKKTERGRQNYNIPWKWPSF